MEQSLGMNVLASILCDTQKKSQEKSAFLTLRLTQIEPENCAMTLGDSGKTKVGAEIRRRRKALKMTLEELAHLVDSDSGGLSRVERGVQGYSDQLLRKIATALGCAVADLFVEQASANVSPVPLGSRRIPLISYVQAGHMSEAIDPYQVGDAADWLLTDLELSANAFALRIKGDSMLPDFREGDTVVIDPAVEPIPGDYVVAKNGDNEATFKKYRPRGLNERGDTVFELVPLNEDYPSMRSDITPIRIIGTMVEHRRYRKR